MNEKPHFSKDNQTDFTQYYSELKTNTDFISTAIRITRFKIFKKFHTQIRLLN